MASNTLFKCFLCEESFSRPKTLDHHLSERHGQTPVWDQALPRGLAGGSLRSSRSNRHLQQDSGPQGRIRGGVVDHDPMEGLPVRRWEMMDVTIKQDVKDEEKENDGKEGTNPNWPWPDLPLPKDFHLLPAHSQELLRRARAPNKNPNIAVFNRETGEYERLDFNPNNPAAMTSVAKASFLKDNNNHPSSDLANLAKDIDHDAAEMDDNLDGDKPVHEEIHERTITVRRWVPLPQSIADKKPEPKYLADRRPGLPPLYGHRAATNTFTSGATGYAPNISSTLPTPNTNTGDVVVGSVTVPADRAANASGYRVSADGTTMPMGPGINAGAGMPSGQVQGETPRRRPPPPPPKRKKKGGPGRSKKKIEIVEPMVAKSEETGPATGGAREQVADAGASRSLVGDDRATAQHPTTETGEAQQVMSEDKAAAGEDVEMGECEDKSCSSDEEGSEEGEIDEGGVLGAVEGRKGPPEVSVQPPSPDLLGNLESEIQGMEKGAPTA